MSFLSYSKILLFNKAVFAYKKKKEKIDFLKYWLVIFTFSRAG